MIGLPKDVNHPAVADFADTLLDGLSMAFIHEDAAIDFETIKAAAVKHICESIGSVGGVDMRQSLQNNEDVFNKAIRMGLTVLVNRTIIIQIDDTHWQIEEESKKARDEAKQAAVEIFQLLMPDQPLPPHLEPYRGRRSDEPLN